MDRRVLVQPVFDRQSHVLAFFQPDQRCGDAAVDRDCMAGPAIDREGGLIDRQTNVASVRTSRPLLAEMPWLNSSPMRA